MKQMKLWMLAVILTLCGTATAQTQTQTPYDYYYRSWDTTSKEVKTETRTCTSYTAINGTDTSDNGWVGLYSGWYVVTGNSEYKVLNVLGDDVHLIIPDNVTLTLTGGLKLETGNKLTIYGQNGNSGKLFVTNSYSGAAGIGGGKKASCGTLEIHGSNIRAQGGEYGAGIGSGDESDNMAGYITIYGGTVEATGGLYAAGIGGGDKGDGANLKVYGGTVKATANSNAAGIGGGRYGNGVETYIYNGTVTSNGTLGGGNGDGHSGKGNGGRIEISGGTVTASGRIETGDNAIPGAGIGCGFKGESATVVISGGTVTATAGVDVGIVGVADAAGIGGGGYYTATLDITISGGTVYASGYQGIGSGVHSFSGERDYVGTLTISGGKVYATGKKRAIGGADASGFTLYNEAQVKAGATSGEAVLFSAAERVPACLWRKYAAIEPCEHSGATYTVTGATTEGTHLKHCAYCSTAFETETHTFVDGKCSVCDVASDVCTVTVYVPKANTQTDGDYDTPISYQLVKDETFQLPPAPNNPDGMEFAGWVTGDVSRLSFITSGSGTLLEAESEYTITTDIILTARYRYLDIELDNNADNSETLVKYNGKTARSVTLTGRTFYRDGSWNTLCLPFSLNSLTDTPLKDATIKTLSKTVFDSTTGTLTLNFEEATAIEAGKPYIVKWSSDYNLGSPEFSGVTISYVTTNIETDAVTFMGIYSPYSISGEDKTMLYLGADNKLYYPNAAMTIGSCRAYFKLADGITAGNPASAGARDISNFVLNFGEGETTSLNEELRMKNEESSDVWYDLQGRRIVKPSNGKMLKGIYINNGRKIIIK